MSHSGTVTAVGNKISAFVRLKGGDASKVDQGISKSNKALEDNEGSDGYGDVADATVATLNTVLDSIDKFESGDPAEIAIGVLDILAEVSAFATFAGPKGAMVAAVVGPLCTIIKPLLVAGTGEPLESDEKMMERVVTKALAVARYEDLKDMASGVMKVLKEKMKTVIEYLDIADEMVGSDIESIKDPAFTYVGAEFLGTLRSHIERKIGNKDFAEAERTAALITAYSSIAFVRCKYLYMLSSLRGIEPGGGVSAKITRVTAEDQKAASKELLRRFLKRPDQSNHVVYSKVFLQPQSSLDLIQALCNERSEGKLMMIYNTKQKNYLQVKKSESDRSEAKTTDQKRFWQMPLSFKFVVFGSVNVEIFSVDHAGYIYADGANVVDTDRRRVNGWKKGQRLREIKWASSVGESSVGSVFLKNTHYPEYLYAADFGASGGQNPVYTWRRGTPVNQGYWIFEDCPLPKNTTRIRSVSSGNYLDGRSTMYEGLNQIYLTAPRQIDRDYFVWGLIKLRNGTYNIKSLTSNMYLDGRHRGIGDGNHVKLAHLTSEKARTSRGFMWSIKEYNYGDTTRYAIQSMSSKLYLDGRKPENTGAGQLHLTESNPRDNKFLMWELNLEGSLI